MTVTLYKTLDDTRKVQKSLTRVKKFNNVQTWDTCPIDAPTFLLAYDADIMTANYFYVEEWGRYYFMDAPVMTDGGRILITGSIDVLKTYADSVLNLTCTIVRTAKNGKANLYLDDGKFKVLNYPRIQTKRFPNSLNKGLQYVLTIAGGG